MITVGIILALRFSKSPAALIITLDPPSEVTVGQLAVYQLKLENKFDKTVAENVVMEYTYPEEGVEGAWAKVEWVAWKNEKGITIPPPGVSTCGSTNSMLRCVLERIEPAQTAILEIYVLPGPYTLIRIIQRPQRRRKPTRQLALQRRRLTSAGLRCAGWRMERTRKTWI